MIWKVISAFSLVTYRDKKYVFLFTMNDTDEGIHTVESSLVHEKILHASSHTTNPQFLLIMFQIIKNEERKVTI